MKKTLNGVNHAGHPFEQPTKFNLFVTLKTAKKISIEIPAALLAIADEVIE